MLIGFTLAGIMERRQGHIGRVGIAINAFSLWQLFYRSWTVLPELVQWYLNLGTIFALVAVLSYLARESLPTEFYSLAFLLYGSLSIVIAVLGAIWWGVPIW